MPHAHSTFITRSEKYLATCKENASLDFVHSDSKITYNQI